jgi:hypothetical protein
MSVLHLLGLSSYDPIGVGSKKKRAVLNAPDESASSEVSLRKRVPDGMKVFGGDEMLLRWSKVGAEMPAAAGRGR